MKVITIILARGGSKGIPKKSLVSLNGKPLIVWSIEQALQARNINEVWLSSDSCDILEVAHRYGAKTIKRPDEFATDTSTSESALKHALEYIGYSDNDIVVYLQATSPLRKYDDIDNSIQMFLESNLDSLFSAVPSNRFMWKIDGVPKSVNYDYRNRQRRQDFESQFIENGSIYIFKPDILFERNNRLGGKIGMYIMKEWQRFELDEYNDIELFEFYIKKHKI